MMSLSLSLTRPSALWTVAPLASLTLLSLYPFLSSHPAFGAFLRHLLVTRRPALRQICSAVPVDGNHRRANQRLVPS